MNHYCDSEQDEFDDAQHPTRSSPPQKPAAEAGASTGGQTRAADEHDSAQRAAARHGNSASREARREGDFVSSSPGRETPSSRDDDDDDGADAIASTDARATSDEAKEGLTPKVRDGERLPAVFNFRGTDDVISAVDRVDSRLGSSRVARRH